MRSLFLALFILLQPIYVFALANVYYSVSPFGTGDIKTGSPTLTISSGTATLTVAQTGNIGVGCRITYDTSSIMYISAVNSSTSFDVVTAIGGTPGDEGSAVTVNSIAHEYASMSAAEAGFTDANHINNSSLVAADVVASLVGYYDHDDDTTDDTSVNFSGTTTDTTRKIVVFTPQGASESINNQRSITGQYSANTYRMYVANATAVFFSDNYVDFIGIASQQYLLFSAASGFRVQPGGGSSSQINISHCYFDGGDSIHTRNIIVNSGNLKIFNTTINGFKAETGGGIVISSATNVDILNCTIQDNTDGIQVVTGTVTITNSTVFNNTDDISGTVTLTYSMGDDSDFSSGTGNSQWTSGATDWNANFTDYSTDDCSVKDINADIYNAGTDLSGSGVTDDIIGTARPQGGTFDIGAFELISVARRIIHIN